MIGNCVIPAWCAGIIIPGAGRQVGCYIPGCMAIIGMPYCYIMGCMPYIIGYIPCIIGCIPCIIGI